MDSKFSDTFIKQFYPNTQVAIQPAPFTILASPSWRGVDADAYLVKMSHSQHWLKHYFPETQMYINIECSFQAASLAGQLHIAPKVLHADLQQHLLIMRYLEQPWRVAGLQDLGCEQIRSNVIAAKKIFQLHATALVSEPAQLIFQQIEDLAATLRQDAILCPKNITAWLDYSRQMQQQIEAEGMDLVPCHRDGNVSNIMIGPDKQIQLIDFDLAAQADPFEDIGCFLMEAYESKSDAQSGFEQWQGGFDLAQFERAWVYGILDDLRWGLIALNVASVSERKHLEFAKYGSWRLMRFEENLAQQRSSLRI
ncbi:phosphotransferase family enzyme [Acinetobacter calcoaceticus]|uniref:Phosphotransferase family enzyme n=1 Tax=Acinetobacter calcoaceticus TaxID=471 RepID=A0A4V2QZA8_ACICA|nr:phosphotransferase family enzyme [Acinetobacter calcoaceticus]